MNAQKNIDFIGIGAQKSATTWLYRNLKRIPNFNLPPLKELHYFDRSSDYESPNQLSESLLFKRMKKRGYLSNALSKILLSIKRKNKNSLRFFMKWFFSNYSDQWYLSLFKGLEGFSGEITPSYSILNKTDIQRMHRLLPEVKLILILRNPIDRAWSHYRHSKRHIKNFNFDKVPYNDVIKFMESQGQSLRSDYDRTINNYLSVFQNDQVLICFYDALADAPEKLMKDILKHICGDDSISISHLKLSKVVYKSPASECPKEIEEYLKNRYHDQIKNLSEKYGGYFSKWYEDNYGENSTNKRTDLLPSTYLSF